MYQNVLNGLSDDIFRLEKRTSSPSILPMSFCTNSDPDLQINIKACLNGRNMLGQHQPALMRSTCWVRLNTMLGDVGSNLILFKIFIQHCPDICRKTFEMTNSVHVDECAGESFRRSQLYLKLLESGTTRVRRNCIRCDQINFMYRQQPSNIVDSTMLGDVASV